MRTVHALTVALAAAVLSDWAGSDLQAQTTEAQEKLLAQYREAEALTAKGRVADAIRMYEQIVERAPDVFGADSKDTANMINNLAELYGRTAQYSKALPLYQRSLKMYEAVLGKDDLAVATSLDSLGWAWHRQGDRERALYYIGKALGLMKEPGKDRDEVQGHLQAVQAGKPELTPAPAVRLGPSLSRLTPRST